MLNRLMKQVLILLTILSILAYKITDATCSCYRLCIYFGGTMEECAPKCRCGPGGSVELDICNEGRRSICTIS